MPNLVPLPDAAALLGVSVDTVRRRIRSGAMIGAKDTAPPHRWRVELPGELTQSPAAALEAENARLRRELAALEADNEALRRELADVRGRQRAELERLDAALATMATMARALPAPPTDPPRRRRRWPWQREAR